MWLSANDSMLNGDAENFNFHTTGDRAYDLPHSKQARYHMRETPDVVNLVQYLNEIYVHPTPLSVEY